MFFGEFQYRVDEKGRMPIPPRFRRDLKDGLIIMEGVDKCLTVYSLSEWKKLSADTTLKTPGSVASEKMRRLNRFLYSSSFSLLIDGQGRIALPLPLREYAGITDEVVVTGVNNYIEIWSKGQWEAEKALVREQAWQIIEGFERR